MAQFDVHRNPNPGSNESVPFLLDIQNDVLSDLATRVVVPLYKEALFGRPSRQLNPRFTIEGVAVIMSTAELAGIRLQDLGPVVGSLSGFRDDIIAALDFLIVGSDPSGLLPLRP